ncbi:hypothetical protein NSK_005075 [Nannochloropsis salina CCMP1776]|uniref:Glutaredoxin domain-containing protein n=1 Tax=Nannochloropsis salina CCMP1776 TaxID=1027361 RepID=A0A4D9CXK9_9STRA|nr:hypothetical protein NSK_005075 [Nannochloropsis salina CCMP1776]|eukprot:TFJ83980.1 hypothetical protein NSK_005075 [Nannochloropsis salina CCMP1776]
MGNLFGGTAVAATAEAMDFVKTTLRAHKVVVFSKTYCPFASMAKRALQSEGAVFHVVELDQRSDGGEIQAALAEMTGRRTVPNVFLEGKSIGGGDDTVALARAGKLKEMLSALGALK